MPLDAADLEIVVVGPDGQFQVQRERQDIDIVRVASTHATSRFCDLSPVLGAINHGEGKGSERQKQSIEMKPFLAREYWKVVVTIRRCSARGRRLNGNQRRAGT